MPDLHLFAQAASSVADTMTPAQAILAVLSPIGTFFAGAATIFMRRHFKHMDVVESSLKARDAADLERAKLEAAIVAELQMSRTSRAEHATKLIELEQKLTAKMEETRETVTQRLDNTQLTEVRNAVHDLRVEVASGGVGAGSGIQLETGHEEVRTQRRPVPSAPELGPPSRQGRALVRG